MRNSTKPETVYAYTDKDTDQALSFSPQSDLVVITYETTDSDALDLSISDSLDTQVTARNPQRGFAVVTAPSTMDSDAAADTLRLSDDVANALPVMVDGDGLTRYFVPDECTVQFAEGIGDVEASAIIEAMGSEVVVDQRTEGYFTISIPEGKGLFETIRELNERDDVEYAEPSEFGVNDDQYMPNDNDFALLWGLRNTGQNVNGIAGTSGADISVVPAWDITRGDRNVIVTVIDTGADLDHSDLKQNVLPRGTEDWDFAANDSSPDDEANNAHGTHVAGTACGVENAGGVIGVAPRCRLMPLRINLKSGMNANRADAINYTTKQAVKHPHRRYVINCSWKMSGDHTGVRKAIRKASRNNIVVVFAAGNATTNTDITLQYPGVYPGVIAVAATDSSDVIAWFSNFGTNVDISGPGVNTYSALDGNIHGYKNGTSMASPHVAGVAALVWSVNPELTALEVRRIVENTADDIDALNPNFAGQLGTGRVNAARAVAAALKRPQAVATAPDGSFVVVWADDSDGNGYFQIRARGFDKAGAQLFAPFTVNTAGAGQQLNPDVAIDENGNFVVVWQDDSNENSFYEIFARGFNADGSERFGDMTVNSDGNGQQLNPRVACDRSGNFVVVWQDDSDQNGYFQILARGFNADGSERFGDMTVNSDGNGQQLNPDVAVEREGNFVVVWQDDSNQNGYYEIFMRGFNADGSERFGDLTVNSNGNGQQLNPSVAMARDGRFVVAWQDDADGNGYFQVLARAFLLNGLQHLADFTVNTQGAGQQLNPAVAVDGNGTFAVAWEDDADGNGFFQILARGFEWDGTEKIADLTINSNGAGQQVRPAIAMGWDNTSDVVVAWADDGDGDGDFSPFVRGLRPNGVERFSDIAV